MFTIKCAFVSLGFAERNEAFDFNVALSDHEKYLKRAIEEESKGGQNPGGKDNQIGIHPAPDHRLKIVAVANEQNRGLKVERY